MKHEASLIIHLDSIRLQVKLEALITLFQLIYERHASSLQLEFLAI